MSRIINNPEDIEKGWSEFYEINSKILQMKWTDIEIRKYWMHEMQQETSVEEAKHSSEFEPNEPVVHKFDSNSEEEESTNLEELD